QKRTFRRADGRNVTRLGGNATLCIGFVGVATRKIAVRADRNATLCIEKRVGLIRPTLSF
ncbi:MAG TPA: hypothetical protein PLS28_03960, partial [Clostridiales bacterium]|nr:hypothetical protein [Clostridiales bacterium]